MAFHIRGTCITAPISLMRDAPEWIAASATSGLQVSTEIGMGNRGTSRSRTGSIRLNSSAGAIGFDPGRVDSPPMSIISAPSSKIAHARSTARSGSLKRPPSENESGVTLSIPMTTGGRGKSKWNRPIRQSIRADWMEKWMDLAESTQSRTLPGHR